jgi:SAM-dependent methyltransferase
MFFRHRAAQAECLDAPDRPEAELRDGYLWLGKVNHLTRFSRPFEVWLPRELGEEACRRLSILDVGAGDGLLGRCLEDWAAQRGWDWQVTNLDMNARALALNPTGRNVTGSATALPFPDDAFDVVIASQMTHHLETETDVVAHGDASAGVVAQGRDGLGQARLARGGMAGLRPAGVTAGQPGLVRARHQGAALLAQGPDLRRRPRSSAPLATT